MMNCNSIIDVALNY